MNYQFNGQLFVYLHGNNCATAEGAFGWPTWYYPPDVLAKLRSGDPGWENMVPPEVSRIIKEREFFGYRRSVAA